MLGGSMRPAVVASRMKRATYSGSRPISGGRILTATLRPRPKCSASQTDPMPPVPSLARMRHFSNVLPVRLSSYLGAMGFHRKFEEFPAQLLRELQGAGGASVLVPGERAQADRLELARGARVDLGGRRHRPVQDAEVDLDDGGAWEGDAAREGLVEQDPERIDVAARVGALDVAHDLLGRHVVRRADLAAAAVGGGLPQELHLGESEV